MSYTPEMGFLYTHRTWYSVPDHRYQSQFEPKASVPPSYPHNSIENLPRRTVVCPGAFLVYPNQGGSTLPRWFKINISVKQKVSLYTGKPCREVFCKWNTSVYWVNVNLPEEAHIWLSILIYGFLNALSGPHSSIYTRSPLLVFPHTLVGLGGNTDSFESSLCWFR